MVSQKFPSGKVDETQHAASSAQFLFRVGRHSFVYLFPIWLRLTSVGDRQHWAQSAVAGGSHQENKVKNRIEENGNE